MSPELLLLNGHSLADVAAAMARYSAPVSTDDHAPDSFRPTVPASHADPETVRPGKAA
jgi:hypothetical protein